MPKYVVTYTWEETCHVEAESPKQARDTADNIALDPIDLDLTATKVRRANKVEEVCLLWPSD